MTGTKPIVRNRQRPPKRVDLPKVRTSERGGFKRCHWMWWMEFEELLKPRSDVPALRFGNLIHQALATYYKPGLKRGVRPWITFEKLYEAEIAENEAFGVREDDTWIEAGEMGDSMLRNYVEHYTSGIPSLPDEEFEVLLTEVPFQQVVYKPWTFDPNHPPTAQRGAEPWFLYVGILDGIWRHRPTKRIHIVDHKTTKAIQLKYLAMDDQATAYWTWGMDWIYEKGLLKPKEKPSGMLFNFLRKARKDARPTNEDGYHLNKDGSVSKQQPAPYFARVPIYRDWNERDSARERVYAEFQDMERVRNAPRNGTEPPPEAYKNPGQFTCPGCWMFDICELHETGNDWQEYRDNTTKPWLPYAQHEVEAAERK